MMSLSGPSAGAGIFDNPGCNDHSDLHYYSDMSVIRLFRYGAQPIESVMLMLFHTRLKLHFFDCFADGEKVSDYEMKLMDLDTEHLGIPVSLLYCLCFFEEPNL